jgi:NADPH-dependent curcumin reductase CurA
MIADYNSAGVQGTKADLSQIIIKSLRIQGFIATQHFEFYPAFYDFVRPLIAAGKLHWQQTVYTGIENAPDAFFGLFTGENQGRCSLNSADPGRHQPLASIHPGKDSCPSSI